MFILRIDVHARRFLQMCDEWLKLSGFSGDIDVHARRFLQMCDEWLTLFGFSGDIDVHARRFLQTCDEWLTFSGFSGDIEQVVLSPMQKHGEQPSLLPDCKLKNPLLHSSHFSPWTFAWNIFQHKFHFYLFNYLYTDMLVIIHLTWHRHVFLCFAFITQQGLKFNIQCLPYKYMFVFAHHISLYQHDYTRKMTLDIYW